MIERTTLWMRFMLRWIRSGRECRKLKRQRDVLHAAARTVFNIYQTSEDLLSNEQKNVFAAVTKELDGSRKTN